MLNVNSSLKEDDSKLSRRVPILGSYLVQIKVFLHLNRLNLVQDVFVCLMPGPLYVVIVLIKAIDILIVAVQSCKPYADLSVDAILHILEACYKVAVHNNLVKCFVRQYYGAFSCLKGGYNGKQALHSATVELERLLIREIRAIFLLSLLARPLFLLFIFFGLLSLFYQRFSRLGLQLLRQWQISTTNHFKELLHNQVFTDEKGKAASAGDESKLLRASSEFVLLYVILDALY